MKFILRKFTTTWFSLTLGLCMLSSAEAHLMVAQHGTLNIVGDGAYLVLSLPVSAFDGIDDDQDGQLSMDEFTRHRATISEAVQQNVVLRDGEGSRPLQGVMLSPVAEHETASGLASQVIVVGRFALQDTGSSLHFQVGLFGEASTEQLLEITATREFDHQEHRFELTPDMAAGVLFPGNG